MFMDMEVVATGLDAAVSCLGTYSGMMDLSCDAAVVIPVVLVFKSLLIQ